MLTVEKLEAGYGAAQILFGVDLSIGEGEVVTLLGRNGMGKTTTVRAIMGLLPVRAGRVTVSGRDLTGAPPFRIAQAGIGLVPEGRQVFPTLSVEENLIATAASRFGAPRWTLERVYAFLPRLKERKANRGNQLSGGEQQMLAIGRALMLNPRLLLLDEPTEGLAPIIVEELLRALKALFRDEGLAAIVIEQHARKILELTDDAIVLERGRVVLAARSATLLAEPQRLEHHLGLAAAA
jgi:branched-chain amino acid transport system ATP-binding protein